MALIQVTPAEQATFAAMLQAYASGAFVTTASLNAALNANGASFTGSATWQTSTLSGGVAYISSRQGRITYCKLDTEGLTISDDCDTITGASSALFADGDLLFVSSLSNSRVVTITSADNVAMKGGRWSLASTEHVALFVWHESAWRTLSIAPDPGSQTMTRNTQYVDSSGGLGTILANAGLVDVIEIGGETLAQGSITITAGGGNISAYIDEGAGPFLIGTYYMSAPEPIATATTNFAAAITALGTGYTAANVANIAEITAAIGTGATANGFTLSVEVDGTAAATVSAGMGVLTLGANGTETNCTLSYISGGEDTQIIIVKNAMTTGPTVTLGNVSGTDGVNSAQVLTTGQRTVLQKDNGTWEPFAF